jgi:pilus assembly protein CpaC
MTGQTRRLIFPDVPKRVFLAVNEKDPIASLREVPHRPREWYLIAKKSGTTSLDVWLPDANDASSQRVLHYVIRIHGLEKEHQETITERPQLQKRPTEKPSVEHSSAASRYQALEQEINRTFPGCMIHLKQEGEKLVVSGTARNLFDATRILIRARQNAPGTRTDALSRVAPASPSRQDTLDNYAQAGGPQVVNLLHFPGQQQIMLRMVVAEVNRAALRSLGVDFGVSDRQATILTRRPAATEGSSTIVHNGWIVLLLKTLQELHYARFLAEPTLTTLNGQAAHFQAAGGRFPIAVLSPSSQRAVQDVVFQSYGVQLSIQPVIADLDRIRLSVDAEVSGTGPQATTQMGGTTMAGLTARHFQSTVELREGETVAISGLIPGSASTMLPQNIRLGSGVDVSADHELVVLISPLLHWPPDEGVGDTQRLSPQAIELYLQRRTMLVPRGDDLYLIGPQGYAGGTHANSQTRR